MASNLFAASPVLVGVDEHGQPLTYGSGWGQDKEYFVSTPLVCDDGSVAFVFPSNKAFSKITKQIGANKANFLADNIKSSFLFSAYDVFRHSFGFAEEEVAWSTFSLLRGANNLIFAFRNNNVKGTVEKPFMEFASSAEQDADFPDGLLSNVARNAHAAISGDGTLLAVNDQNGRLILLDSSFRPVTPEGIPQTDGQSFALSPDGSQIFFSSSKLNPDVTSIGIFAYDLATQSLTTIATKVVGLDTSPQITAAQNNDVIAFVTNNNDLLTIFPENSGYVDEHKTQIVVAQMEDGIWKYEWCSGAQELSYCKEPALSADGRFVVFAAQAASSSIQQIWRYDRALKQLEQVTEADMDCMAPAISPNGRLVAFVTKATNLGYANSANNANVWAIDMGTSIVSEKRLHHLSTAPSGHLFLNGKGKSFPYDYEGGSFGMDATGSLVAFNTTVKDDTQTYNHKVIYLRDISRGIVTHMVMDDDAEKLEGADLLHVLLSGDGRHLFFTRNNTLFKCTITPTKTIIKTSDKSDMIEIADGLDTGDYAVSHDGSTLAYLKSGVPYINVNGMERAVSEEQGFSQAMISRDGLSTAFLAGNTLYLCDTATGTMTALADNIAACAAPMSIKRFLILQNGALKWLSHDGTTEALTLSGIGDYVPNDFVLSANGRFLAYRRIVGDDGLWQACRYDLLSKQETVASLNNDGIPANNHVTAKPKLALNADGSRICFVSPAKNLLKNLSDDFNKLYNELYLATFNPATNTPATFTDTNLAANESQDDILFELAYKDTEKNDALPMNLVAGDTLHAAIVPYGKWYAVKIRPENPYFCGKATLSLSLWDGTVLSSPQTFTLTVNNVNNPPAWKDEIPANVLTHTISEGENKDGADYAPYVDDPDLANPAPFNTEKLTFSLVNAPQWATVNGCKLHFAPGHDVTTRGNIATSTFNIIATDSEGESTSLEVTVKVQNTNRPPQITAALQEIRENAWLNATDFTLRDEDPEDQNLLKLRLSAPNGSWFNEAGNEVTFPLALSAFPIRFQSNGKVNNSLTVTATLYDDENAASTPVSIKILLTKVQVKLSTLWPSLVEGASFILQDGTSVQQTNRWLMLATPYSLPSAELATALGADALWVWQSDCYSPAPETLAPGQGFAVQIGSLCPDSTLNGQRGDTVPLLLGWNLIGASAAPQAGPFFMLLNNTYIKLNAPPDVSPLQNWGIWTFSH